MCFSSPRSASEPRALFAFTGAEARRTPLRWAFPLRESTSFYQVTPVSIRRWRAPDPVDESLARHILSACVNLGQTGRRSPPPEYSQSSYEVRTLLRSRAVCGRHRGIRPRSHLQGTFRAHVEGGSGRSEASPTAILHDTHSVEGKFSEVDYLTENQLNLRLPQAKLVAYQDQRLLDR